MIRTMRRLPLAVTVALLSMTCPALAAKPRAGRTYRGTSSSNHSVKIKVSRNGKHGVFTYCGTYKVGFRIHKGHFNARSTIAHGAVTELHVHGSWKTRDEATGYIDFVFGCGGRPGPWSATLK